MITERGADRSAGAGLPGAGARRGSAAPAAGDWRRRKSPRRSSASEAAFEELWQKVEAMLTSYSDEKFVSDAYARELCGPARARSTSRPQRRSARAGRRWLGTVADALAAQSRPACCSPICCASKTTAPRWRDIAETVITHAEDLVRVGYFDQALTARGSGGDRGRAASRAQRRRARAVLDRLGRGAMMRHAANQLRHGRRRLYERLKRLATGSARR